MPIWRQALTRSPAALIAGLAMSWAFEARFAGGGVQGVKAGVTLGALLFATLIPATVAEHALRVWHIRLDGAVEVALMLTLAAASGAIAGVIPFRRPHHAVDGWRSNAMVACAAATVALTLVMGGPIPVGNSARAARLFAAFLPITIAAGVALAAVRTWLTSESTDTP